MKVDQITAAFRAADTGEEVAAMLAAAFDGMVQGGPIPSPMPATIAFIETAIQSVEREKVIADEQQSTAAGQDMRYVRDILREAQKILRAYL